MFVSLFFVHLIATQPGVSEYGLPVLPLYVKSETLLVEIADRPDTRMLGLMYREYLPDSMGMLFIFERPQILRFWMKNTSIPLDIAFIKEDGTIIDIQTMAPFDTTLHSSPENAKFALEVNRGWFKEHGITVGDTVRGPAFPR